MSDRIRLDRYLAEAGAGTRSEVKKIIRAGRVQVVKKPSGQTGQEGDEGSVCPAVQGDLKIDPETDEVLLDQKPVKRRLIPTLMLNKPAGVVSATQDTHDRTVLDLIQEPWADELFPVGRLDKDTEGLLLLTSDGKMSHELLSPKRHVKKTYFAVVSGPSDPALIERFRDGLDIGEKKKTLPAELVFLSKECLMNGREEHPVFLKSVSEHDLARCSDEECCILVTITEGRFHQIKRMFMAVGREVRFLKRISMGGLFLDPALKPGQYRPLAQEELDRLRDIRL